MVTISKSALRDTVFLWLLCCTSIARSEAQDMKLPFSSRLAGGYDLELRSSDLQDQVSLNEAVKKILRRDLKTRKSILEARLPADLADREFLEKLTDYANVGLIEDVERLVQLYEKGDEVWVFESKLSQKKSKGFLLMRQGEVLHLVILELILV